MRKVKLTINGVEREVMAEPDKVLLDLLREDLDLTGTKQSCDRKGQCGACSVIVDGKVVLSCLKKVVDLEGANVISVEGLGTSENPHLIQEAFVLAGAVQCGYCIPGMIMATKALLDKNPNPSVDEIKKALARNMCRCTGYKKIIDAVVLAGEFLRNEKTPDDVRNALGKGMIGVSHPRPTAMVKACGEAKFTSDIKMKDMVHLAIAHSTEFHAIIKSVDTSEAEKMPGVVGIMTAKDVKGTNRIRFAAPDQPVLCEDKVRTLGDPIVAVAAKTREQARTAAAAVKVAYEPLPVMMTPEEAMAPGAYQIHDHIPNLGYQQPLIKGDAEKALAGAAVVIEGEFSTQTNHQAPLEPEASLAYLEKDGDTSKVVVVGRSIVIHMHADQIAEAVGAKIRYQEAFVGGQFGIKIAVTTEAVTAAAAMHFKRPVSYVPSMAESMTTTTKRHPYTIKTKLAADADGHIVAFFCDFVLNKGAYAINGKKIMHRSVNMLSGAYNIPNIKSLGKVVFTNNAPGGAARGAGPPQTMFALEMSMNMLAEKMGIDPLEFRKMNALKPGQTKATGMAVKEWPFPELCDTIKATYDRARKDADESNKNNSGPLRRGIGIGACAFGITSPGDVSEIAVEINPDDTVTIYGAVADPGEGNDSMLAQLATHVLDLPLDKINLYTRDTDKTWSNGPSAGSRQTWMSGGTLVAACEEMRKAMDEAGSKTYEGLKKAGKPAQYKVVRKMPDQDVLDPVTGQGPSFLSECHNIQLAEVEVNTNTGAAKVIRITSAVDMGPVINPQAMEGQLEGGVDQGVGYALREEYIHGKTNDYIKFKFPKIADSCEVIPLVQETIREGGTLGATGVGETTMVSTAPAVSSAIKDACGVWMCHLPATPEKVKAALNAK